MQHTTLFTHQTQTPTPETRLDVDDLCFLRVMGIGLRHVKAANLDQECKRGIRHGDMYSLANFGLSKQLPLLPYPLFAVTETHCKDMQTKIRLTIQDTLTCFSSENYNDACFLLIANNKTRGNYDINNGLGKCGSANIDSKQILEQIRVTSKNNNIESTTADTLEKIICSIKYLKRECLNQMKVILTPSSLDELDVNGEKIIDRLLALYDRNISLSEPLFASIVNICRHDQVFHQYDLEKCVDTGIIYCPQDHASIFTAINKFEARTASENLSGHESHVLKK